MSFNIRYDNPADEDNWWEYRKKELVGLVEEYSPSIMGIQEGLFDQVSYIDFFLPDYRYIGVGRDDGEQKGEYTAIFFKQDEFELLSTDTYWLSETPEKVSVGWDASMERIVTYGAFRKISSDEVYHVFNCHFDHLGHIARKRSAELILKLIEEKGLLAEKLVVMGDLNAESNEEPISVFRSELQDAFQSSKSVTAQQAGTFNGFDPSLMATKRIDYIFYKNLSVKSYRVITDHRKNGLCISDHFPVMIEIQ